MKTLTSILLSAITFAPAAVFAHPGHGHENPWSPGHFLGNPVHAIPIALIITVVSVLIGRKILQARSKKEEPK